MIIEMPNYIWNRYDELQGVLRDGAVEKYVIAICKMMASN